MKPVSKDEPKKKEERLPKVELKPVKQKETDKDGPLDKVQIPIDIFYTRDIHQTSGLYLAPKIALFISDVID